MLPSLSNAENREEKGVNDTVGIARDIFHGMALTTWRGLQTHSTC
jgi:hypothetical protein